MGKLLVDFRDDQTALLREMSSRHGVSMNELVRQCLDRGLCNYTPCGITFSGGVVSSGFILIIPAR